MQQDTFLIFFSKFIMINEKYLENMYSEFSQNDSLHLWNAKYMSSRIAKSLNDMILSTRGTTNLLDSQSIVYCIVIKKNGNNESNKIEVIDYSKVSSYFQITIPENKTCIRLFNSPLGDNKAFYGYYAGYEPKSDRDNKFGKNTEAAEEGFVDTETFNFSSQILRMVNFLFNTEIDNFANSHKTIFH